MSETRRDTPSPNPPPTSLWQTGARPLALLAAVLLCLLPGASPAQETREVQEAQTAEEAAAAPEALFESAVDVQVVNVEVRVLDKQGNPVTGLGPEDFEIYEDGERMEIANFFAVDEGRPVTEPGETAAEDVPEDPRVTPPPPPEDRQLHMVLYVDNANMSGVGRKRVVEELSGLLGQTLDEGGQVMVVSSYPRLTVHTPFTSDLREVHQGLAAAIENTGGSRLEMDRRRLLNDLASLSGAGEIGEIQADRVRHGIRSFAERKALETRRIFGELEGFLGSLAGKSGRKFLVHLSEGLETRPGESLFNRWEVSFGAGLAGIGQGLLDADEYDTSRYLFDVAEKANESGVTFFTLDASGGDGSGRISPAENRGLNANNQRTGGPQVEALEQYNVQNPIRILAAHTGGETILNATRPGEALAERAQHFDTYYSLGYAVDDSRPGVYRSIEVKVKRPGLRVLHREGFREVTRDQQLENRTVAALLHNEWSNPLRMYLEVGEPEKHKKKQYRVPVAVKVPMEHVTLLPFEEDHRGRLRMRVAFQGENGYDVSEERVVPLVVPNDRLAEAREQHVTLTVGLTFRPGSHKLAVSVYDEVGTEASYLPYDIYIPED